MSNPYESPQSHQAKRPDPLNPSARSFSHVVALLGVALLIAFAVTPSLCVLAWLEGYGPGGMNELQSGYPIRGMIVGSVVLSPVHFLSLLLPTQRRTQMIGYAVSAVLVLLMSFYWFIMAAAIAHV